MKETYKLKKFGVLRMDTHENIPEDLRNSKWLKYLEWLKEGNDPEPEFTLEELRKNRSREVVSILKKLTTAATLIVNDKKIDMSDSMRNHFHAILYEQGGSKKSGISDDGFFYFVNDDASQVRLSLDEIGEIHTTIIKFHAACQKHAAMLYALIEQSLDPYEIDIEKDWPTLEGKVKKK